MSVSTLPAGMPRIQRLPQMQGKRRSHKRMSDIDLFGILFWSLDEGITGANDTFLEMIGYTAEDAASGRVDWNRLTPAEYAEQDQRVFAAIARTGRATPFEKEFYRRDGGRISTIVGAMPLDEDPGRGIAYVLDVSNYKRRVEEERILAELSQRALGGNLTELFDFAVRSIQKGLQALACRIVLREEDEILTFGCTSIEMTFNAHADIGEENGRSCGGLQLGIAKAGSISPEQQTFLQAAANVLVAAVRQKRSVEALALREQQRAEHMRLEALGRLAGGIAHDFNNLLTAILGYAELALGRDPSCREELDEISRAGSSAADLVRQLLAIGRRQQLQARRIDLGAIVKSVERMLRRLLGEDIELECLTADDPICTVGDPVQIEQVVMNLVLNARDAIKGRGRIVVSVARVLITSRQSSADAELPAPGRYAALTVSDTGEGMDEATRRRIFEPFFTTKDPGHGTGLGLATVHGIVDQSGGRICVRSAPKAGSIFTAYLPLADAVESPDSAGAAADPRGCESVLLVDDDAAVTGSLAQSLRLLGYDVLTATSPSEALHILSSDSRQIHALVTDVAMPMMNGSTLARRANSLRPGIETVFMSGYSTLFVEQHGVTEDKVIQKPFTCHEIAIRLRRVLDNRQDNLGYQRS